MQKLYLRSKGDSGQTTDLLWVVTQTGGERTGLQERSQGWPSR